MIKAFIFDLDGTLIDSERLWCKAMFQMLAGRGISVTDTYTYDLVFGRSWHDIVRRLRADYPVIVDGTASLEGELSAIYATLKGTADICIPGSVQLLARLGRTHPVAIVSGSTRRQIEEAVALMGVGASVNFFLGSEDYPRGKPDPSGFLMAAERFDVAPEHCLVFEDSAAGIRAARMAGMRCIALQRRHAPAQDVTEADQVLSDLADFDAAAYGVVLP